MQEFAGVFPHVAKMPNLELTTSKYPKNTRIPTLPTSGPPTMKKAAKHIFVWVTKGTAESTLEQIWDSREACFNGLVLCHFVPANPCCQ